MPDKLQNKAEASTTTRESYCKLDFWVVESVKDQKHDEHFEIESEIGRWLFCFIDWSKLFRCIF